MNIIISNSSDKPIYEQISTQLKNAIISGELKPGDKLPSIRQLASDLRISVITTKRSYQDLEAEGFVETVQGKGSFVAGGSAELWREERLRRVEAALFQALEEAAGLELSAEELHQMLDMLMEDE